MQSRAKQHLRLVWDRAVSETEAEDLSSLQVRAYERLGYHSVSLEELTSLPQQAFELVAIQTPDGWVNLIRPVGVVAPFRR